MVRKIIGSIVILILSMSIYGQGSFMFNQHGFLSAEIDTGTYINFIVETSSLQTDSIQMAMNTDLKDSLIQFYGDLTLYNSRVNISEQTSERIFNSNYLGKDITTITTTNNKKIVNIVFEDEVSGLTPTRGYYDLPFDTTSLSSYYENDISEIRTNAENWVGTLRYTGVVFWVDTGYGDTDLFLDAVYYGKGVYSGQYGVEDRQSQFVFYYSDTEKMISDRETRGYYTERIIEALRDLGFNL